MSGSGSVDEGYVPARSPAVHTVDIDGEAVLLDQAAERLHHLNATAALVWACLDGRSTVGQIASDLGAELGVPVDTVLADTMAVIATAARRRVAGRRSRCLRRIPTMAERWRRGPAVLWRRSLDAVLVLPPAVDDPLTLAGTGAGLWDLLAVPTSTDDLVDALAAQYAVDRRTVEIDIVPVLSELEAIGVIEAVPGRPDPRSV